MKPAIKLIRHRRGLTLNGRIDYEVLLYDAVFSGLHFSGRGYCGVLPLTNGDHLDIGERGISAYRREVVRLNKEFKNYGKVAASV